MTEMEEFLEYWSIKSFLKNWGFNKPIWINGPTLEQLKSCQDQKRRNAYNKYIHLFLVKHRSLPNPNRHRSFDSFVSAG